MKCPFCKKYINLREEKIRSLPQSKYYWGVCIKILSDELGYTDEEIHEVCKSMFLKDVIHLKTKGGGLKEVVIVKSTRDLTTIEFEDYLSKIRVFASLELGIFIPEPNEEIR